MANVDYVTENKLTVEADNQRDSNRKTILFLGIGFAVAGFFIHFFVSLVVLLITMVIFASQNGDDIARAGALGEDIALLILEKLPDAYTIFNQVDIPNSQSRTGVNEADLVVHGPSGVFVIEVKHNNSHIEGSESDREWEIHKIGRGGTAYSKTMRNPIKQVKKLVWLLGEELKKTKSKPWIQGMVLFTNESADLSIQGETSVPVLRNDQIISYILNYEGRSKAHIIEKSKQHLIRLKTA